MADTRLRDARERAGLTQAQLAARADVSRQTVGAVEAGRHVPAVDAAMRLAAALDTAVEALFGGPSGDEARSVLGGALPEGAAVVVGRVGERLCAAPLAGLVAGDAAWALPDGVVEDGRVRLLPGASAEALVVAGCDPALGLCEALLSRDGSRRVVAVAASSGAAVDALASGRIHAALVHGPEGALPGPPRGARRTHLARWRVGIGAAPGVRARSLDGLLDGSVDLVQREPSAAAQGALTRALARAGRAPRPGGPVAAGHVDAARRAALGGCAAVTFEPAARQHGLRFTPLEEHAVELWTDERWLDHPDARALGDLLASGAFARRIALVGGYDLAGCGDPAGAA